MATAKKTTEERKRLDTDSQAMMFEGVTLSQMASLFRLDLRDVRAKLANKVTPAGERRGVSIYLIHQIAPYLVKPVFTDEELDRLIARMTIADMPPMLRKEFWAARRAQQAFEKEAAILVNAEEVAEVIGELLKTLRMGLLLTRDMVERETELTETQRGIVTDNIDQTLNALQSQAAKRLTDMRKTKATIREFDAELEQSSRRVIEDEEEL